jgi:hypothetical protein
VDVYDPSLGPDPTQPVLIHDLNPGILPSGLFWTIEIPEESIQVNLGKGRASMEADDVPIIDDVYGDPDDPRPTPGSVSFKVSWSGVNERLTIRNTDPVYGGFAGMFIRNKAQMEWSATVGDFTFVSARLATSSSLFAEIGHERNGIFFSS